MTFARAVAVVLLLAYVGRIVGALFHDEDRSFDPNRKARTKVREIVDALAWPITMFTSKAKRGLELSMLRVLVALAEYFVVTRIDWTGDWNGWKVAAILGPPGLLILEPLFAMIPIRELSLAAAAYLGTQIAKRVRKTSTTTETETPVVVPPDNPTEVEETTDGDGGSDAGR